MKKAACLSAVMLIAGILIPCVSKKSSAAETETLARVTIPQEEVFASVRSAAGGSGIVDGDGVRLRQKASKTSTILELMYNGEFVTVLLSQSTANWYYLQRVMTGTYGYANKKYIVAF